MNKQFFKYPHITRKIVQLMDVRTHRKKSYQQLQIWRQVACQLYYKVIIVRTINKLYELR